VGGEWHSPEKEERRRKYFEGTDTLRVPPRNKRGVIPKNQKGLRPNSFGTLNLFMQA